MSNLQIVSAAATPNVEPQLVEMMVPLYSYGCVKKVQKSLSHLKGIYSVHVDYHLQKVTVWGICNKFQVLSTVRSKRKAARFWNPEDCSALENSHAPSPPALSFTRGDGDGDGRPMPSFTFNKFRSLSLKLACKKVFAIRSYLL